MIKYGAWYFYYKEGVKKVKKETENISLKIHLISDILKISLGTILIYPRTKTHSIVNMILKGLFLIDKCQYFIKFFLSLNL